MNFPNPAFQENQYSRQGRARSRAKAYFGAFTSTSERLRKPL